MASKSFNDAAQLQVPDDHLGIFSGTRNESITLADVDVCDEVKVAVQAGLEGQCVAVPHLENPTTIE